MSDNVKTDLYEYMNLGALISLYEVTLKMTVASPYEVSNKYVADMC